MKNQLVIACGLALTATLCIMCERQAPPQLPVLGEPVMGGAYNPPPVRTFPSNANVINGWINAQDFRAMRAHAWDIWQSINTPAPDGRPIWETWYSGHELFEMTTAAKTNRKGLLDFEFPSQFFHASVKVAGIPSDPAETPTSFNRYSPSLASFIYEHRYYDALYLDSINSAFNQQKTPIIDRQISTSTDSVDAMSFALKPVFQFISGDSATAIPFWAGVSPYSTRNLDNPTPDTWRQCVIVDPTGKLKPGEKVKMKCNCETEKAWPVVALSDFYAIKITAAQEKAFSQFAETSGDDVGADNNSSADSIAQMVKAGNYALLAAMHVTGKETVNWTWQTFWWSPNPYDPVFGDDRPKNLPAPWSNYNMLTAYNMVYPLTDGVSGQPVLCYNPYLETNLKGTVAKAVGIDSAITWYGSFSNCMSCHRLAAWGKSTYISNGYIDPGDPLLFSNNTKTDFLWSIPVRADTVK